MPWPSRDDLLNPRCSQVCSSACLLTSECLCVYLCVFFCVSVCLCVFVECNVNSKVRGRECPVDEKCG